MKRRDALLAFLAFGTLASPTAVLGQSRGNVPTIGYLTIRTRGHALEASFVAGMRELGYVDGKNIAIEWRFADGKAERLPVLAAELVALRVNLIVAASTQAIQAAGAATTTIPVVFPGSADPVGAGFVKSLSRPGGNITGLSTIAADLGAKQIELLRAVVPRLSRIAILVNPTNAGNLQVVQSLENGARAAGLAIMIFEAKTSEEIERAFAAMAAAGANAVTFAIDGTFFEEARRITRLALNRKLPLMSPAPLDGSLMSYGASLAENYRRTSIYVDKILKGAHPSELPVEQPTRVELVLDLKIAKSLGITIPQSVLLRADRVID